MTDLPMTDQRNEGLWAWQQPENHNRLIELQQASMPAHHAIELAYFGGSAFRLTTPAGLSLMIDPWRNPPWGTWNWYLYDFPQVQVDVGVSTHAHFDHDGLHRLRASTLLDRPIGTYTVADLKLTGIPDKHVCETTHNAHDWAEMTRRLTDVVTRPPGNWRSFDNVILLIETAGLRILHWGDNRPDPPEHVWAQIQDIDIALLPIDGSYHVLSAAHIDTIIARLGAKLVVPHHYGAWDITTRGSTLLPPDPWVNARPNARWANSGAVTLTPDEIRAAPGAVLCFGNHVAFDKPLFRSGQGA